VGEPRREQTSRAVRSRCFELDQAERAVFAAFHHFGNALPHALADVSLVPGLRYEVLLDPRLARASVRAALARGRDQLGAAPAAEPTRTARGHPVHVHAALRSMQDAAGCLLRHSASLALMSALVGVSRAALSPPEGASAVASASTTQSSWPGRSCSPMVFSSPSQSTPCGWARTPTTSASTICEAFGSFPSSHLANAQPGRQRANPTAASSISTTRRTAPR